MSILVEERDNYRDNLHCPFCDQRVQDMENGDLTPCVHTLFVANDEGFEFCDERTKNNLEIPNNDDPSDHVERFGSIDDMTSSIDLPNSKKIAVYVPAPSFFGAYYGFVEK